jgi:hypothetical protein
VGDYAQIKATGTGPGTTAYILWSTYDRNRSDVSPGQKRDRVICTTIPPAASNGACCVGGACTAGVTEAACLSQGGVYHPGVTCASVVCGTGNNACANAIAVSEGNWPFSTVGATTDGPTDCLVNQDIWYRYTAVCGGTVTLAITGANYNWAMSVYEGATCPVSGPIACNTTGSGFIFLPSVAGHVYTIRVGGTGGASGTGTLVVQSPTGPAIDQQPSAQSACPGSPASFSVTAEGGTPLSYQWRHDGVPVPGATGATYQIASVQPADVGAYTCVVSNPCGEAISNSAALTLSSSAPSITQQPAPAVSLAPGQTLHLSVTATGTSLTYQWKRNNVNLANDGRISGATSANLTIAPLVTADDGHYTVAVGSGCGSLTSSPSIVCYVNTDLSTSNPILNVGDFVAYQSLFAAGDPRANCDGSTTPPVLNVADFVCFQTRFVQGCP